MPSNTKTTYDLIAYAVKLVEAERGCILRHDGSAEVSLDTLTLLAGHKIDGQTLQGSEFEACYRHAIKPVFEQKKALVTSNSSSADTDTLHLRGAVRSIVCVPLKMGDEIFGVLYVDSQVRARVLTSESLPPLLDFAGEVAQTMGV